MLNQPPSDAALTFSPYLPREYSTADGEPVPALQPRVPALASTSPNLTVADRYPWKNQIVTTTFWIGERPTKRNPTPNHISSWDRQWTMSYGGYDDPERRRGYHPADFVPRQNPFYVALPYNDKMITGHKPEARDVIPWFGKSYSGPAQSVCKGRWIAIRMKDRVCYAQWEDCGPFRTDHWQYVFGDERPITNTDTGAGLDVSPAVRDYLGMCNTGVTDWKFVDFDEVPPGPWSTHGDNNTFVINERREKERLAAASKPSLSKQTMATISAGLVK